MKDANCFGVAVAECSNQGKLYAAHQTTRKLLRVTSSV